MTVRKGMPSAQISREQFEQRMRAILRSRFRETYKRGGQNRRNGVGRLFGFAQKPTHPEGRPWLPDPDYDLSVEWVAARRRSMGRKACTRCFSPGLHSADQRRDAQRTHLSWRNVEDLSAGNDRAGNMRGRGIEVELLDLSRTTSEYGRNIFPCKTCVSTAMPLCHWPCTCYPNHSWRR